MTLMYDTRHCQTSCLSRLCSLDVQERKKLRLFKAKLVYLSTYFVRYKSLCTKVTSGAQPLPGSHSQ